MKYSNWSNLEHILQLQLRVLETLVKIEERRLKVRDNIVRKSPELKYVKSCLQELSELVDND